VWTTLQEAAARAMEKNAPVTRTNPGGGVVVAAPLVVERGPAGALVIETPARVEPTEDDLELLALFSSQAAVAIRTTHELERLRSGALAALGRMATQVAHELKNPLAGLRLYARHLEQRLERNADHDGAELARKITGTVDNLAAVVNEITAFGRTPELRRAPTDLKALLEECITFGRAKVAREDIEVVATYDAACPLAPVDARELRKAFLNLILNALESIGPGGGRLAVTTSYAPAVRTITVTLDDTGAGMSEETLARVFDLFFTTKPEGTGLGMALARSVITRHGGQLAINSEVGQGTRVIVRLPTDPAPPESGEEEAAR
jgi:two-component system sensor histidine kinase HydH